MSCRSISARRKQLEDVQVRDEATLEESDHEAKSKEGCSALHEELGRREN